MFFNVFQCFSTWGDVGGAEDMGNTIGEVITLGRLKAKEFTWEIVKAGKFYIFPPTL